MSAVGRTRNPLTAGLTRCSAIAGSCLQGTVSGTGLRKVSRTLQIRTARAQAGRQLAVWLCQNVSVERGHRAVCRAENGNMHMVIVKRIEAVLQWVHNWALWWLVAMLFFFGYDIYHDAFHEGIDFHVVMETLTFGAVTAVLMVEWRRNKRLSLHLEEASGHSQRLSGQFSEYVRVVFAGWSFSKSEHEVAWLLLKGFTFAEIAALRGVQEKTVRQQATGIYAKSGCKNRNEFLASFIQDLLEAEHLPGVSDLVPAIPEGTAGAGESAGDTPLTSASDRDRE